MFKIDNSEIRNIIWAMTFFIGVSAVVLSGMYLFREERQDGGKNQKLQTIQQVSQQQPEAQQTEESQWAEPDRAFRSLENEKYIYTLESRGSFGEYGHDSRIVRVEKTRGNREVLTESIDEISGFDKKAGTLWLYKAPNDSDFIFLRHVFPDTDRGYAGVWKFNLFTKEVSILNNVSSVLAGWGGTFSSPNNQRIVTVPDAEGENKWGVSSNIYLVELERDNITKLVSLSEGQTFNAGCGALSNHYEIYWLDNNTISYKVFEQTKDANNSLTCNYGSWNKKPELYTGTVSIE